MNDIFVLYKQVSSNKLVDTFRKGMTNRFADYDFTIRDYDDSLPDESCYESTRSLILLCIIDDEWFYDPQCRTIWKYFWEKQLNYNQQILFPVLIEDVKTDNFNDSKKSIYHDALKLGFYHVTTSDSVDIEELYNDVITSLHKVENDYYYTNGKNINHNYSGKSNVHEVYKIECSYKNDNSWIKKIEKYNKSSSEERIAGITDIISELRNTLENKFKAITDKKRLFPKGKKVCVIYTGGTAGMIYDPFEKDIYTIYLKTKLR